VRAPCAIPVQNAIAVEDIQMGLCVSVAGMKTARAQNTV
jgi:hypothetical protein